MDLTLLKHLQDIWDQRDTSWGKVYRVEADGRHREIAILVPELKDEAVLVWNNKFLPKETYMLTLPGFDGLLIRAVFKKCQEIGFYPLFRGTSHWDSGRQNGEQMQIKTFVLCPNETDGIVLQAYLDTL